MIFFAYVTRMSSKNDFIFLTKEYNNNKGTLLIGDHKNRSSCKRLTILQKDKFSTRTKRGILSQHYISNPPKREAIHWKRKIYQSPLLPLETRLSREFRFNAHPTLLIPIKYHKHFFLLPKDKDDR